MPNRARRIDQHYYRARHHVLARDPLCARCGERPSEEVDHIVPLAKGGGDEVENLQGLCRGCHREKTQEDFAVRKTVDAEGNPIPAAMEKQLRRAAKRRAKPKRKARLEFRRRNG